MNHGFTELKVNLIVETESHNISEVVVFVANSAHAVKLAFVVEDGRNIEDKLKHCYHLLLIGVKVKACH